MLEDDLIIRAYRDMALEEPSDVSSNSSVLGSDDLLTSSGSISTTSVSIASELDFDMLDWRSETTPSAVSILYYYPRNQRNFSVFQKH